jgi:glycerol-3-phosphate dehydrogenase
MTESSNVSAFNRERQVQKLTDASILWDVLVIGGGATGLGVALDAVSRGYRTLLVEQADFAKGTSSRSTKLVHGGVRYLAQGNMRLVREASVERGILFRNAAHLVHNQTFIIPVYNYGSLFKYAIGLKLYDWISGTLSMGSSNFINRSKTLELLPGIKKEGLLGGVRYHDGQFDDARLAVNLMQTIIEHGGSAVNYVRVEGLLKDDKGQTAGARVRDEATSASYDVKAKAVVNATGVFVDTILNMDNNDAEKQICVSQGTHIVLDKKFYPSVNALMIPETSDGRVLFVIPWHNKVILGTTDTPVTEASLEPKPMEAEIEFILQTAKGYLDQSPERGDVLSMFAGLRPLAISKNGGQKTKEISRSHKVQVTSSGLFTILGGKWTTYRKMGEDTICFIEKSLGWKKSKSRTMRMLIHGYTKNNKSADHLHFYGSDAPGLLQHNNGSEDCWISETLKIKKSQVLWAVHNEMAMTVEDVLSRRTRALLLDARESIRVCRAVAGIMAEAGGHDEQWIENEVSKYTALANGYI